MGIRLAYLHLTLTHCNGQGEGRGYFHREYLCNASTLHVAVLRRITLSFLVFDTQIAEFRQKVFSCRIVARL